MRISDWSSDVCSSDLNIIAIPLTTFVIMPLEAVALLLDPLGLSGLVYPVLKLALTGLVAMAKLVAQLPGGVTLAPAMSQGAFGRMVVGGRSEGRRVGKEVSGTCDVRVGRLN